MTTDHLHPTVRGHRAPHPPLPAHKPPGNAVSKFLFPDHTVGELAKNIQVAVVPGGLLETCGRRARRSTVRPQKPGTRTG